MSAVEETKPITDASAPVDPPTTIDTPSATEPATTAAATEATTGTTSAEPIPTETAEEKPVEDKAAEGNKTAEPITTGTLKYNVSGPGLKAILPAKKLYFWLGDEEEVPTQKLGQFLRGEKPNVAHPTAAWASQSGKGLLFFAKHADDKSSPSHIINLADITDLAKVGPLDITMKLHGIKNTLSAKTQPERDGWFVAIEEASKAAASKKEEMIASPGYKETMDKLGKPATLAVTAATGSAPKTESTPKKSMDGLTAERGTDSSKKTRSVSRGKRGSIFGSLLGKKEEHDVKKEDEVVDKKDETKPEELAAPTATESTPATEPAPLDGRAVAAAALAAPIQDSKPAEGIVATDNAADAAPVLEEPAKTGEPTIEDANKKPTLPKPSKRGSVFGNFFEKVRSPVTEKKESDVAPAVPPKDNETAPVIPLPTETAAAEPPIENAFDENKEAPAVPPKAERPTVEKKESFFEKFLHMGEKAKTPTTETAPVLPTSTEAPAAETTEAPKIETEAPKDTPAVEDKAPITNGHHKEETGATEPAKTDKRRSSFFSNLGGTIKGKKEPTSGDEAAEGTEKKTPMPAKLGGLFRNPSKMMRGNKETKKEHPAPTKVEETTEAPSTTEAPKIPEAEKPKEDSEAPVTSIGDVVPEAVSVGTPHQSTPHQSTPTVQATA